MNGDHRHRPETPNGDNNGPPKKELQSTDVVSPFKIPRILKINGKKILSGLFLSLILLLICDSTFLNPRTALSHRTFLKHSSHGSKNTQLKDSSGSSFSWLLQLSSRFPLAPQSLLAADTFTRARTVGKLA